MARRRARKTAKGCVKKSVKFCYRAGRTHKGAKHCGRRVICAKRKR